MFWGGAFNSLAMVPITLREAINGASVKVASNVGLGSNLPPPTIVESRLSCNMAEKVTKSKIPIPKVSAFTLTDSRYITLLQTSG